MNSPLVNRPSVPIIIASILILNIAIGLLVPMPYQATLLFGTIGLFSAVAFGASFRATKRNGMMLILGIVGIAFAIMCNEWFYQSLFLSLRDDIIRYGALFGTIIGGLLGITLKR